LIPRSYIVEWRSIAPWISDTQVEQDLLICRVLISLFSNKLIAENLAFRGGTALHKLFLNPPSRYSEDIDLVQINAGAIGPLMDALHETLDGFLGTPKRKQAEDSVTLIYRADSEIPPVIPLKLKVEINTREHFSVLGYLEEPFSVDSRWFSGNCKLTTYNLDELRGTKLRALYQRRKGRDLFDLWLGLTLGKANPNTIVQTFRKYMETEGHSISNKEFRENLLKKMQTKSFLTDTDNLLRPTIKYDRQKAFQLIDQQLLRLL
jgi:predicted nucleotidyltransferase component of viral defense system